MARMDNLFPWRRSWLEQVFPITIKLIHLELLTILEVVAHNMFSFYWNPWNHVIVVQELFHPSTYQIIPFFFRYKFHRNLRSPDRLTRFFWYAGPKLYIAFDKINLLETYFCKVILELKTNLKFIFWSAENNFQSFSGANQFCLNFNIPETVKLESKPGPSFLSFVSVSKYFISRVELNNTGDVSYYMTLQSLHPQSWEFFPDITDHYRTQ